MELLMTESHMHLQYIKSSPSHTGHNSNRSMSSFRLNLLTKTTWKLKPPGGILVFRVLGQVCSRLDIKAVQKYQLLGSVITDGWVNYEIKFNIFSEHIYWFVCVHLLAAMGEQCQTLWEQWVWTAKHLQKSPKVQGRGVLQFFLDPYPGKRCSSVFFRSIFWVES